MAKHKNKIIAAFAVLAILVSAWLFGGHYNQRDYSETPASSTETPTASGGGALTGKTSAETEEAATSAILSAESALVYDKPPPSENPVEPPDVSTTPETPSAVPEVGIDPETEKSQTAPMPEGQPAPVELEDVTAGDGEFTITLSVRCDMILDNMNLLDKEKRELVPTDGVIFPATVVTVYEGESVFNVLHREMKRARIHMAFRNTPVYNSAYIEGVNNLYEFDAGELSGWIYKVNGWFPNYGCSRYQPKPGDVVEWHYTCELGRDLGEYGLGGAQRDE